MAWVLAVLALVTTHSYMAEASACYDIGTCGACIAAKTEDTCVWCDMCQPNVDPCRLGAVTEAAKCEGTVVTAPNSDGKTTLKPPDVDVKSEKMQKSTQSPSTKPGAVADTSAVLHVSWMALLVVPLGLGVIA